jgi:hypothetical protein
VAVETVALDPEGSQPFQAESSDSAVAGRDGDSKKASFLCQIHFPLSRPANTFPMALFYFANVCEVCEVAESNR